MTRILVPTDFSEPSLAAVRSGIELAMAAGGVVLLLHVVEGASVRCYAVGGLPHFLSDMIDLGGDSFAGGETPDAGVFQSHVSGPVVQFPMRLSWLPWCSIWMPRIVLLAWSPPGGHAKTRMMVLNLSRRHTPPVGTNVAWWFRRPGRGRLNFLPECRSGDTTFDLLMEGRTCNTCC
jgi:hypothetical protein